MAMRKKLTIGWNDIDYSLIVTMEVIERIEEQVNLAIMNKRTSEGDIRFSHAARLIAIVLNEAGCNVTASEVYESLYLDGSIKPMDLIPILNLIYEAAFPEPEKK
jgi:predicted nucleic acid-binding protein